MELQTKIFFSCIITCYNREDTVESSIKSILNQTYQDFEIIVVDDCSKDSSIKRIQAINDTRIKIIRHHTNQGQNAALNTGVENALFEVVAFLDSDDVWEKNYLAEMASVYLNYPKIGFCYTNLVDGPQWTLEGENKYANVLNQGYLSSMITITAKKQAINTIGGFDLKYSICQDDDFCFRLAKKFAFKVIQKPLARIIGANNSMSLNSLNVVKGWAFLFENYKDDILHFCGPRTYSRHLIRIAFQHFEILKIRLGFKYYFLGIVYFFTPKQNNFRFSMKELITVSINILKMFFAKLKNKNLNHG